MEDENKKIKDFFCKQYAKYIKLLISELPKKFDGVCDNNITTKFKMKQEQIFEDIAKKYNLDLNQEFETKPLVKTNVSTALAALVRIESKEIEQKYYSAVDNIK